VFYAMQPYLLELYGDPTAYSVAGLAAAIVAAAQIVGGLLVNTVRRLFTTRTSLLIGATVVSVIIIAALGVTQQFWLALVLFVVWGLVFSLAMPVRQAYLNGLIQSSERATVLSFDALVGSSGGVVAQPILGRVADVTSYGQSYLIGAAIHALALPFLFAARNQKVSADRIETAATTPQPLSG
jgi:MFS family permease